MNMPNPSQHPPALHRRITRLTAMPDGEHFSYVEPRGCVVSPNLAMIDGDLPQDLLDELFGMSDHDSGAGEPSTDSPAPNVLRLTSENADPENNGWARDQIDSAAAIRVLERATYVDIGSLVARQARDSSNPTTADVLRVVENLRNTFRNRDDIEVASVRPVYMAALEQGHWSFEPGGDDYVTIEDAAAAEHFATVLATKGAGAQRVAIVDSGFPGGDIYPALAVGIEPADAHDFVQRNDGSIGVGPVNDFADVSIPSHGAFVTSLIATLAPDASIMGARPIVVSKGVTDEEGTYWFSNPDPDHIPYAYALDEVAVDIAIDRLRERSGSDSVILNLSLGFTPCNSMEPTHELSSITKWRAQTNGNLTVFAAAGNTYVEQPFYPAKHTNVEGVEAKRFTELSTKATSRVAWPRLESVNGAHITVREDRPQGANVSADQALVGVDVVGVGMAVPGTWGGSSFATAFATGIHAAGNQLDWHEAWRNSVAVKNDIRDCDGPIVVRRHGGPIEYWCQ